MKQIANIIMALALSGAASAETVRSDSYEATADRRAVSMKSESGGMIPAQQVLVTVTRRDGAAIDGDEAGRLVGMAEKVACRQTPILVSLVLGAGGDGARYDVLCAAAAE